MGWPFTFNNNSLKDRSVKEFIIGLCRIQRQSSANAFRYCKNLEKNLADFKSKSSSSFIEQNDDDNICAICLSKLVGHCTMYHCECNLTIHESCMFRLMLGGIIKCPICDDSISLKKYNSSISYPMTINIEVVEGEYNKLLENKSTTSLSLKQVEINVIKDTAALKSIYRS
jgi:hypothetical protein